MKLARYGPAGAERPAVLLDDGTRIDASAQVRDYDEAFFAGGAIDDLRRWVGANHAAAPRLASDARVGCPIARPSKIVCIGLNFRDHAAESGMDLPKEPVLFFKATSSIAGPDDDVRIPRGGTKLDWEVELAVVIGRAASYVEERAALDHVAGYALHNDYSERHFQLERGGQWVKGKSCDTFAPIGPYVATRDEIPDPQALDMWLTVNGETRQRGSTKNMVFGVAALVSYVSQFMTLLPGDVISTGTPAGVGLGMKPEPVYLKAGDVVELGIDKLGRSRQQVVAERAPRAR
jgi:2-keto-4-pentenoate hydratase/2-oxohepta-3-ene-1,7-dioic acid hydratase in catechol pathway